MSHALKQGLIKIYRDKLLVVISLAAVIAVFFIEPVAQDLSYHQFSDQGGMDLALGFSIPHFWNVVSNFPFILVGLIGLNVFRNRTPFGVMPELKVVYITFFIGVLLTGFGSSYYHWNPTNTTLVWDRLPMTLSFMAFFTVIVGENISVTVAKRLFAPLLVIGLLSVVYWIATESKGSGDLRFYALVQFLPVLLIPLILWFYSSSFNAQRYIIFVLLAYVFTKIAEHLDREIFEVLHVMSGHPIKHVIAALGTYLFYLAVIKRRIIE